MGGKCSNGGTRMWLRPVENWKRLVSHQSACRSGVLAVAETRIRPAKFVSRGELCGGLDPARHRFHTGGVALRRDASDARTSADPTRRTDCSGVVVRAALLNLGHPESST